jgi:hypothetical protein
VIGIEHEVRDLLEGPAVTGSEQRIEKADIRPKRSVYQPEYAHLVPFLGSPKRTVPPDHSVTQPDELEIRPAALHPRLLGTQCAGLFMKGQAPHYSSQWN